MTKFRRYWWATLVLSCWLKSYAVEAQETSAPAQSVGNISLFFSNGGLQCRFPATSISEGFAVDPRSDSTTCRQLDNGGYFQLQNMPSATTIWLANTQRSDDWPDSRPARCGRAYPTYPDETFSWWELKTLKETTTMAQKVHINDLKTKKIGDVIVPGVRLVGRFVNPDKHPVNPDHINCLMMDVSQ